jgi:hypothetical protein
MASATEITYSDLVNLDTGNWPGTLSAWGHLVEGIEVNADYLDLDVKKPLAAAWQGDAAQLAQDKVSTTHEGLQGSKQQIKQVAGDLTGFYNQLSKLRWGLTMMVAFPTEGGLPQPAPPNYTPVPTKLAKAFIVSSDGTVDLATRIKILSSQTGVSEHDIGVAQNTFQNNVNWFVNQANELDAKVAGELRGLMPKPPVTTSHHQPAKPTTMGGGPPVSVKQWPDPTGSLWGIAQQVYGNGNMWPYIYHANVGKPGIPSDWNPDVIDVGWNIEVPKIPVNSPVPPVPSGFGKGSG